jgi:hypothetical protein
LPRGQAQGPHPSPHPPLVPTGRWGASIAPFDYQKSLEQYPYLQKTL